MIAESDRSKKSIISDSTVEREQFEPAVRFQVESARKIEKRTLSRIPFGAATSQCPRATLKTFLDSTDALAKFLAQEYLPSPTLEKFLRASSLSQPILGCLDLSYVPPAARWKAGRAAAVALYETLNRIDLSAREEIPGADQAADKDFVRWVIPHTEITTIMKVNPKGVTGFFGEQYGGGPVEFHEIMLQWHSDGQMKGLKLS